MKLTDQKVVTKTGNHALYTYCDIMSAQAEPLYNAAIFRIRQVFTGWTVPEDKRHPLQKEVFKEMEEAKKIYPSVAFRRVLSYTALEKILRATNNPDFFCGLPMQTAQHILKSAVQDFKGWLNALKEWKKSPDKFTGKPKMPGYHKKGRKTFSMTNQDAVLYPAAGKRTSGMELKLPLLKTMRISLPHLKESDRLKEVTVKPFYGRYILFLSFEVQAPPFYPDMPNFAGIDFGFDNLAALVCTDSSSFVYKGGAIASNNRLFAKEKALAVSEITKGTSKKRASSKHLDHISFRHDRFNYDQLHKISADIIRQCVKHRVGLIVLGVNKQWKQHAGMGKKNNQNFVSMPIARLRDMIAYKAVIAGIFVVEQEESYTSKADITSSDHIPVYGKEKGKPVFSGRRVGRGRYRCGSGLMLNADCNGAGNILRKAIPEAWDKCRDFRFMATPESRNFHILNPKHGRDVA